MGKSNRQKQYESNKGSAVGTTIICPVCGTSFYKRTYQQAFCCSDCKNKFWNAKGDRHKDKDYQKKYNMAHPERLERVGIYKDENGKFGHYDDEDNFWTFEDEEIYFNECENPIEGR